MTSLVVVAASASSATMIIVDSTVMGRLGQRGRLSSVASLDLVAASATAPPWNRGRPQYQATYRMNHLDLNQA